MPDRRLIKLEDQISYLLKGPKTVTETSLTHVPQTYAKVISSNPRSQSFNEPPRKNSSTFQKRVRPDPQNQTLESNFEARVQSYMAAHTEMMERFERAIFKQREEINDRMAEMFGLLRELTSSRTPDKVLVREEASSLITKSINAISLIKMKKEKGIKGDEIAKGNIIRINELGALEPIESPDKEEEMEEGTDGRSVESMKEELMGVETKAEALVETPSIGGIKNVNALIDQGSDVNVMPMSFYSRLTGKEPIGTDVRLSLASHSYIYPLGIAEDVLIDIGGYVYPVDFVILDIKEYKNKPFILGTPFLTTAKAVIRFEKGTITLKYGKCKIDFLKVPALPSELEKNAEDDLDPITPINTVIFDEKKLWSS
ncbi:MAK10-like protein [Tanacetum coccineum]